MPPSINQELLGRLAQGLEESGHALKAQSAKLTQICVQVGSIETQLVSAHARLKKLEEKIDGNGNQGLRTDIALARKEISGISETLKGLQIWRRELGDKKFNELKTEARQDKNLRWMVVLALASMLIALGSLVGTCGPKLLKAIGDEPPVITQPIKP